MMNLRKLKSCLGLFLFLSTSPAWSVGMGDIEVKTLLGEPLYAEIQLTNIGELSDVEVLVGLASAKAFEQAGLQREFVLSSLDFAVDFSNPRSPKIKVTSKQPIKEPYLDFLVEMQWPTGRLLREYVLLIDLPTFVVEKTAPRQVQAAQVSKPVNSQQSVSSGPVRTKTPSENTNIPVAGEAYTVASGDTLWRIAKNSRPEGRRINETMEAVYQLNPSAFINGNRDLIKKGAVLRLPVGSQIDRLNENGPILSSPKDVLQETSKVVSQDVAEEPLFDEPVVEEVADEAAAYTSSSEEKDPAKLGRLKLAALSPQELQDTSENGSGLSDIAENGDGQATDLGDFQDELTKTQRENDELKQRLANLEDQIETMQRMMALNSETGASLQNKPQQTSKTKVANGKQDSGSSIPWWLYVLIIILAVLLAVFLFARSRKGENEDYEGFQVENLAIDPEETVKEDEPSPFQAVDRKYEAVPLADVVDDEQDILIDDSLELDEGESVDPIEQADIYLNLGNTQEAENILKDALQSNSSNSELHLKLLGVYAKNKDLAAFDIQRAELLELDDPIADSKATAMRAGLAAVEKESVPEEDNQASSEVDDFSLELDENIDLDKLATDIDFFSKEEPTTEADSVTAEEECATKLDLAEAYIEMEDNNAAKEVLQEVVSEGTPEQQQKAQELLDKC